ncbi:MAG TPA: DNA-directed RNA polymerase subunit omega [Candidatus Avilachnospira avistercoris]|nr:DNA-directed RNA polymerase subunit omega [Candidatus Avilachnospira avistercoris]
MLRPTYNDLMEVTNRDVNEGEEPIVKSRYSVVIAAAKRARQLVDGAPALVKERDEKPLSIAVEELYEGKVRILGEGPDAKES